MTYDGYVHIFLPGHTDLYSVIDSDYRGHVINVLHHLPTQHTVKKTQMVENNSWATLSCDITHQEEDC